MSVRIFVSAGEEQAPFVPDAVVLEDDTERVLGSDPVVRERYEDVERALARAEAAAPETPGSVLVRESAPVVFHAIVHDLEQKPSWREEWVVDALHRILREADRRKLSGVALPLLGSVHGTMEPRRFVQLFRAALAQVGLEHLEAVWLIAPGGTDRGIFDPLREYDLDVRLGG